MENKYPIRYALMPMYEKVGWYPSEYRSEDYGVVCYIVSKCYVIKEEKTYLDNGKHKMKYSVVFPFEADLNETWLRQEPQFNQYGDCINASSVDQVFNSLDLAISVKKEKNHEIINKELAKLHYDGTFMEKASEIEKKYKTKAAYYEQIGDIVRSIDLESSRQINVIDLKDNTKTMLIYEENGPVLIKKKLRD